MKQLPISLRTISSNFMLMILVVVILPVEVDNELPRYVRGSGWVKQIEESSISLLSRASKPKLN